MFTVSTYGTLPENVAQQATVFQCTPRWAGLLLQVQQSGRAGPTRADSGSLITDGRSLIADGRSLIADGRSLIADGQSLAEERRSLTGASWNLDDERPRLWVSSNWFANQKDAFGRPLPLTGTVERRIAANIGINI